MQQIRCYRKNECRKKMKRIILMHLMHAIFMPKYKIYSLVFTAYNNNFHIIFVCERIPLLPLPLSLKRNNFNTISYDSE